MQQAENHDAEKHPEKDSENFRRRERRHDHTEEGAQTCSGNGSKRTIVEYKEQHHVIWLHAMTAERHIRPVMARPVED